MTLYAKYLCDFSNLFLLILTLLLTLLVYGKYLNIDVENIMQSSFR